MKIKNLLVVLALGIAPQSYAQSFETAGVDSLSTYL